MNGRFEPGTLAAFMALGLAPVALLCATLGVLSLVQANELESRGAHAKGTVVGFVSNRSCKMAEVRFATSDEATHVLRTDCPTFLSEGEHVDVIYLPEKPKRAAIANSREIWGPGVFLCGVGGVCAIASAVAFVVFRRARARSS